MHVVVAASLYCLAGLFLLFSYRKDRDKTKVALRKAWRMFFSVLPQFLAILGLVGLLLAIFDPFMIQRLLGTESGLPGMLVSAVAGAIALIPVLVAFPIASELLNNGAGVLQIAVFLSTLTTVGVVTLSLERQFLGGKVAVWRNVLLFLFAFVVAWVVKVVVA